MIVPDIGAARDELAALGTNVSEVFHAGTPGAQFQPDGASGQVNGPAPDHASYGSFATFSDPDGNGWLLQEVITRLPGRIAPAGTNRYQVARDGMTASLPPGQPAPRR